jgi:hypothetical protein
VIGASGRGKLSYLLLLFLFFLSFDDRLKGVGAERNLSSRQIFRVVALITLFIVVVAGAAQATFNANEFDSIWD